ncbi:MAG: maltose ABC transporter substrate-binding protein [Actinomycetaceae bacterium]|nr:maltose ABC transporter substrate-binding protein [Actinomycetaceae bacterium]
MRRGIALLTVGALSVLGLTACGGGGNDAEAPAPEEGAEAPAESTGQTLTVWVDANREAAFKTAAQAYTDATGNDVELVVKDNEQMRTEFSTQVPTGQGPDIAFGANDWIGEFVNNGLISPVELGDKAGDFSEGSVAAFTFDGQVYGVPYAVENLAIIRNADLVDSTPATFDEMIEMGKAAGVEYPFVIQVGEEGDPYTMYPFQSSFTGPVFEQNEDGSYTSNLAIGGAEGEAFAQWLQEQGQAGTISTSITYDIALDSFKNGQAPYILGGPWMLADFEGMNIAVDPIPSAGPNQGVPFLGVQGGFISAKSQNALMANDFLVNYVGDEAVQDELYKVGKRLPALTASADKAASDPLMAGFQAASEGGFPMPNIPEMGAVWTFWGKTEAQILNGDDPVATWNKMIDDIQAELDK